MSKASLFGWILVGLAPVLRAAPCPAQEAPSQGSARVRLTLDAQGDGSLLVDTRAEGREDRSPPGEEAALSGVPGASVRRDDAGVHHITYAFADLATPAAFTKLNGASPLAMRGVSIDKTAGTLVLTPIAVEKSPGREAKLTFPRTVKPEVAADVNFAQFTAGTFLIQMRTQASEVLALNLVPLDRRRVKAEVAWFPFERGRRGNPMNVLTREFDLGTLSESGFHVPAKAGLTGERFTVEFALIGQAPASIRKLTVSGKPIASFGLSLGPGKDAVQVKQAFQGGAAERAGLRDNDQIVSFDGMKTTSFTELMKRLGEAEIGREVAFVVRRGAVEKTFRVKAD